MKNKKILIIAAHPDDEILGCGGAISKLKDENRIEILFMTNGVSSRGKDKKQILRRKKSYQNLFKYLSLPEPTNLDLPDNEMDKVPLLKIIKKIEKKILNYKPDTVITHYSHCLNIDHRITFEAVITACRPINNMSVKKILSFEIPSSTDWALFKGKNFEPNYFIDITDHIEDKCSIMKIYKKETKKFPFPRSKDSIISLAKFRGTSCGYKFAESFKIIFSK